MIIKANTYIMYCASCVKNKNYSLKEISSKDVSVTIDLYYNKYTFNTTCPACLSTLEIKRDIK